MDEIARLRAADCPDIGVITTPGWAAQGVADLLVRAGVTSILNFAPRVLTVPAGVQLRYVDLSIELQVLGFYRARHELERAGVEGGLGTGGAEGDGGVDVDVDLDEEAEEAEEERAPLMRSVGFSPRSNLPR
jgi:redox-sensing transcriptional repressor